MPERAWVPGSGGSVGQTVWGCSSCKGRVKGLGLKGYDLGLRFGVYGLRSGVWGLGYRVHRILAAGC